MKKLNLSPPAFQDGDVLSRTQLKKVLGGDGGYDGGGYNGMGGGGGGGGSPMTIICDISLIENGGFGTGHYSQIDGSFGTAAAQSFCSNEVAQHPGWVCTFVCH